LEKNGCHSNFSAPALTPDSPYIGLNKTASFSDMSSRKTPSKLETSATHMISLKTTTLALFSTALMNGTTPITPHTSTIRFKSMKTLISSFPIMICSTQLEE